MTTLCSGHYSYRLNGKPQAIAEPWQITSDNGLFLSGQRSVDQLGSLLVRAHYAAARCIAAEFEWAQDGLRKRARYWLDGKSWMWSRDNQPALSAGADDSALLFPLLRAATGPLLSQLDSQPRQVLVPSLHDPSDSNSAFTPVLSMRWLEPIGPSYWRYLGGEYGHTGCVCELNAEHLLKAYHWDSPNGSGDVILDQCDSTSHWSGFSVGESD